jgi:hypothetical protein
MRIGVSKGAPTRAPATVQSVTHCGVKAIALQIDELLRRIDLEGEMRVALAPAADARQQPAVRERRQHRHA